MSSELNEAAARLRAWEQDPNWKPDGSVEYDFIEDQAFIAHSVLAMGLFREDDAAMSNEPQITGVEFWLRPDPVFKDDPVGYCRAKAAEFRAMGWPSSRIAEDWDKSAARWEKNLADGYTPERLSELIRSATFSDVLNADWYDRL